MSVTLVHPTQPVEIFGNVSTPFGTGHPLTSTENFTEIVTGEALRRGQRGGLNEAILDLSKAISETEQYIEGK